MTAAPAKERPILFSAPMVRAILDGRKTQTRRAIKPQPFIDARGNVAREEKGEVWLYGQRWDGSPQWNYFCKKNCPYGVPGDRLWVRETFALTDDARCPVRYYATDAVHDLRRKRPSIHMPRWASRITLEVTGVRVERLQDISEADARAEGLSPAPGGWWSGFDGSAGPDPVSAYALLWEHINGPGSWAANPFVWAVEFKQVQP